MINRDMDHTTLANCLKIFSPRLKLLQFFSSWPENPSISSSFYSNATQTTHSIHSRTVAILKQKFAEGMINHYEVALIEAAASEQALASKQLKYVRPTKITSLKKSTYTDNWHFLQNWITNEKVKHKPATSKNTTKPQTRIPTVKRSLSGLQHFYERIF